MFRPIRDRSDFRPSDSDPGPIQINDPDDLALIKRIKDNNAETRKLSQKHFLLMIETIRILCKRFADPDVSRGYFNAFAEAAAINRTDAYEMVKLRDHLDIARSWSDAELLKAKDANKPDPPLSWRLFAKAMKEPSRTPKPAANEPLRHTPAPRLEAITLERDEVIADRDRLASELKTERDRVFDLETQIQSMPLPTDDFTAFQQITSKLLKRLEGDDLQRVKQAIETILSLLQRCDPDPQPASDPPKKMKKRMAKSPDERQMPRVTDRQKIILDYLRRTGPASMQQIIGDLKMRAAYAGQFVPALIHKGLIKLEGNYYTASEAPQDPLDQRGAG